MKDFTEIEMKFEERDDILHEKLEIVDKRFIDLEKISGKGSDVNSAKFGEIQSKFESIESRFEEMSNVMDNVMDKFYEFETQRKNNLIFYGVPEETNESSVRLLGKIREIIRSQIGIRVTVSFNIFISIYFLYITFNRNTTDNLRYLYLEVLNITECDEKKSKTLHFRRLFT